MVSEGNERRNISGAPEISPISQPFYHNLVIKFIMEKKIRVYNFFLGKPHLNLIFGNHKTYKN